MTTETSLDRCDCVLSVRGATQCWPCKFRMMEYRQKQEDSFVALVSDHDPMYAYSDDHREFTAGEASYAAIQKAAKQLDRAFVVETWNKMIDTKVGLNSRESYYWSL